MKIDEADDEGLLELAQDEGRDQRGERDVGAGSWAGRAVRHVGEQRELLVVGVARA